MTGTYKNTKVSIPRSQMFVVFETTSTVAKRRFKASVLENSIWYNNSYQKIIFRKCLNFLLIGDSCQYWMDLENKKLASPYYPQDYSYNTDGCEWLITAPEKHIISFEEVKSLNVSKK